MAVTSQAASSSWVNRVVSSHPANQTDSSREMWTTRALSGGAPGKCHGSMSTSVPRSTASGSVTPAPVATG